MTEDLGLIETFAVVRGRPRYLDAHLDRMAASARELGFRAFPRAAIEWAVAEAARRRDGDAWDEGGSAVVRVVLRADGGLSVEARPAGPDGLGPLEPEGERSGGAGEPGGGGEPGDVAGGADRSGVPETRAALPVTLAIDDEPVDPASPFLRHKTTRRAVYEAARARHPGADDVVLVNTRGRVTETTVANLAALVGEPGAERWVTPPLAEGLLPGIGRAMLLEAGVLVERHLTPADLRGAAALATVSSTRGFRRARLVDPGT